MRIVIARLLLATCILPLFIAPVWATRLNQEDGIWPNHSVDWVRTLNRNASTDTDASFYNPAGLAFMKKKGLHVQFTNQTVYAERASSQDYYGILAPQGGGGPYGFFLTNNIQNPAFDKMSGIPEKYTAETMSPVLPSLDIAWTGKQYAVYGSLAVLQAAPGLTFKQGLPVMDFGAYAPEETITAGVPNTFYAYGRKNFARRTEYYIGGTIGAAYAFLDWMSAALGIRYINASGRQTLSVRNYQSLITSLGAGGFMLHPWFVDTEVKGHGAGLIFGLHFKPIEIIDIGIKYEYYFPLALKKKTKKFMSSLTTMISGQLNIFADDWLTEQLWLAAFFPGYSIADAIPKMLPDDIRSVKDTLKVTYPQTLAIGFSIIVYKGVRAETSGELSLRPFADQDGRQKNYNLGYRIGQCIEWEFVPNYFISAGYLYTDYGIKDNKRNEVDQLLSNHTIGGGIKMSPVDYIDIQAGAFYVIYIPEIQTKASSYTNVTAPVMHYFRKRYEEKRWSLSVGVTAHLFGEKSNKQEEANPI